MRFLTLKMKDLHESKHLVIHQVSWFNLLPWFLLMTDWGEKRMFATVTTIQFGWLYWEFVYSIKGWTKENFDNN